MYGLSTKKMAVLERSPFVEAQLYLLNLEVLKRGLCHLQEVKTSIVLC